MDDEDLRDRLARLDPALRVTVPTRDDPAVASLVEAIMTMTVEDERAHAPRGPGRARWGVGVAVVGAAAAAALAVVLLVANGDEDEPREARTTELALALPSPLVMASCVPFDVTTLADMSTAFAGTVTEVSGTEVVLTVDRWFRPADEAAGVVRLGLAEPNTSAMLDGVEFTAGQRYLVTAANGTVNGCGFTTVATPEVEAVFEEAFGS
jgi:hypothetical protein